MRKPSLALLAAAAILGSAGAAGAASLPFTGSIAVQISTVDPIAITGSGVATVNGSGGDAHLGGLELPAGVFGVAGVVAPVTDPAASPIAGVQATVEAGAGDFSGSPLGGALQIGGVAKVCLFVACNDAPPANVSVPLSVIGSGGTASVAFLVNVTVAGAGWTSGTAVIPTAFGTLSARGFAHGPGSMTSSTAAPSGLVRLVTPIVISTDIAASAVVPAFGYLTLHFVPEPGTALLLGVGIAGLVVRGRVRRP